MAFTQINKNPFNSWFISLISAYHLLDCQLPLLHILKHESRWQRFWKCEISPELSIKNRFWTYEARKRPSMDKTMPFLTLKILIGCSGGWRVSCSIRVEASHPWTSHSLSQHTWSYTFSTGLSWFFMQNLYEIWLSKVCVGGYTWMDR